MKISIKSRLILCSVVLFTIAVGINVFLNSSSVDRLYEDSTISQYSAIGDYLKAKLTEPLESGQKIDEINNIERVLAKTEESIKQVGAKVHVYDSDEEDKAELVEDMPLVVHNKDNLKEGVKLDSRKAAYL